MGSFIQPALYRILTHGLQQDLPAYMDLAQRFGAPILDLGAGLGRIGHALLTEGHPVVMLEKDAAYCVELEHLHQHLSSAEEDNCWVVNADFTQPNWFVKDHILRGNKSTIPTQFGVIILGLRSIHLLNPEDQCKLLTNTLQHLHPNGALIIHHTTIQKDNADNIWRFVAEHTTEDGILEVDECLKWNPILKQYALRHRITQFTKLGQQVARWRVAHDLHPITQLDLQQSLAEVGFVSTSTQSLPNQDRLVIATQTV